MGVVGVLGEGLVVGKCVVERVRVGRFPHQVVVGCVVVVVVMMIVSWGLLC